MLVTEEDPLNRLALIMYRVDFVLTLLSMLTYLHGLLLPSLCAVATDKVAGHRVSLEQSVRARQSPAANMV